MNLYQTIAKTGDGTEKFLAYIYAKKKEIAIKKMKEIISTIAPLVSEDHFIDNIKIEAFHMGSNPKDWIVPDDMAIVSFEYEHE